MSGPAWCGEGEAFLALDPGDLPGAGDERWRAAVPILQGVMSRIPAASGWAVVLDMRLLRLRRRIDVVLATDRAVLVVQVRPGQREFSRSELREAEDAALDLADFHAGCRGVPVIPVVLVPNGARARAQLPLPLAGAATALEATRLSLPGLLLEVALRFPPLGRVGREWLAAPYAPVPALLDAACMLYARHDVAALTLAQAGPAGLAQTSSAVADAVRQAEAEGGRLVIFVTGEPGAGKTLCGLNLAFAPSGGAAFLTGNPTLVHVLREALVRDAVARGGSRRAARQRMEAVIQPLPAFRDHYVAVCEPPPERIVVIDEAQRCWSRSHAIGKTRNRPVTLYDSEPGHLLDIMARRPGGSVLVCLLGGGQEIHDGEGGLASWGEALAARPDWRVLAPAEAQSAADPRQRLPDWPGLATSRFLHLAAPIRPVRAPVTAEWVDVVLGNEPARAAALARNSGGVPFQITRSLEALRAALLPRGSRTAGLVASSGARRLRAEGLGAMLAHQDDDAVARWFLDRWPDVRSSDALEVVATEFGVQGLELDRVGLCWDADLVRAEGSWQACRFRANGWTRMGATAQSNRINAYRVLLTRARHGTVIWVPRGSARDRTRDPRLYEQVAEYLEACGVARLDEVAMAEEDAGSCLEPALF